MEEYILEPATLSVRLYRI